MKLISVELDKINKINKTTIIIFICASISRSRHVTQSVTFGHMNHITFETPCSSKCIRVYFVIDILHTCLGATDVGMPPEPAFSHSTLRQGSIGFSTYPLKSKFVKKKF